MKIRNRTQIKYLTDNDIPEYERSLYKNDFALNPYKNKFYLRTDGKYINNEKYLIDKKYIIFYENGDNYYSLIENYIEFLEEKIIIKSMNSITTKNSKFLFINKNDINNRNFLGQCDKVFISKKFEIDFIDVVIPFINNNKIWNNIELF